LHEQAERYRAARPWDHLNGQPIFMMLKVGSWYEACAQAFTKGPSNVLFLFPGWRGLLDLQKTGHGAPPPGTVYLELGETDCSFAEFDSQGIGPPDRFSGRLLTLALSAMIDLAGADPAPDTEVTGELSLPGRVRGRYRAVRAPAGADAGRLVPLMTIVRTDLYAEGDGTVTFMTVTSTGYRDLAERAQVRWPADKVIEDLDEVMPVAVVSAPIKTAWSIADKLHATKPVGIVFGETPQGFSAIVTGPDTGYVLMPSQEEVLTANDWWREATKASGGRSALVVVDTTPDGNQLERWDPTHVLAFLEFGSRSSTPDSPSPLAEEGRGGGFNAH
jgi:hypothetical protein